MRHALLYFAVLLGLLMPSVLGQCTACTFQVMVKPLVLDVPGFSTANGEDLTLWTYNGGANQLWSLQPTGDGTYMKIVSQSSGLVVDIGGPDQSGYVRVVQASYSGADSQKWRAVVSVYAGYYNFINKATGQALDAANCWQAAAGTAAGVWPYDPANQCHAWAVPGLSIPSASPSPTRFSPAPSRLPGSPLPESPLPSRLPPSTAP